ncbi:MAG TPA: GAF domain-containing sensor histidine kinase [Longimicrobium sp.]|nr:GAF domain-containing sensor histidine kinase [Longimicrobium sp.]
MPTHAAAAEGRTRFAFLAETSRCLASSLDFETTLATGAGLALPHFGTWCMVDVVEADDTIRRVAVIHPDPEKQRLARAFYDAHPPHRDDPLGAPRVIRTRESEFVLAYDEVLEGIEEEEHRLLLHELGAQSFLMVPMSARGRTLGAITFVSDDRRRYDEADLLLAEDLGCRFAMAMDNARLYAASQEDCREAEEARNAATLTVRRAEELLGDANLARHEAQEAAGTKATFLNTISHEFRTPLTAVQGFADMLLEEVAGPVNEAQRHQLGRIRAASDHLLGLIEEILTYASQQTGRSELGLKEVDLGALVREAAALMEPVALTKKLRFVIDVPGAPVPFRTDPGKLRQIVLNLAANAVKFTPAGEVRVELATEAGGALVRVRDTGIGIASEDAERVFAPFAQVDESNQRAGGTGLGLAVTRQLAGLLGGEVVLEAAPEGGSVFSVWLPVLVPGEDVPALQGPAEMSKSEQRTRGRRTRSRRGANPPLSGRAAPEDGPGRPVIENTRPPAGT